VAESLGYTKSATLVQYFNDNKLDTLVLTKKNGLDSIKMMLSSISKYTARLCLIPASSLQEYLLLYAKRPKAKKVGKKLYSYLSQGETELYDGKTLEQHPLYQSIHTETVAEGLDSEFASWHFKRVFKTAYLRRWNRSERIYNWLMCQSLGFHFSSHWR